MHGNERHEQHTKAVNPCSEITRTYTATGKIESEEQKITASFDRGNGGQCSSLDKSMAPPTVAAWHAAFASNTLALITT